MERHELVNRAIREIVGMHKKWFGWKGESDSTKYYLTSEPDKYNLKAWCEKKLRLEKVREYWKTVLALCIVFEQLGVEDAIEDTATDFNVCIMIEDGKLKIGFGCEYEERMIENIKVETDKVLTKDELKAKQIEKYDNLTVKQLIELFIKTVEREIERVEKHIAWLKEPVKVDLSFMEISGYEDGNFDC